MTDSHLFLLKAITCNTKELKEIKEVLEGLQGTGNGGSSGNTNTDNILNSILDKLGEFDQLTMSQETLPIEYCVSHLGTKKRFYKMRLIFTNLTNQQRVEKELWSQDGSTWSESKPQGVINIGNCDENTNYCLYPNEYIERDNKAIVFEARTLFSYGYAFKGRGRVERGNNKIESINYTGANEVLFGKKLIKDKTAFITTQDSEVHLVVNENCGYKPIVVDAREGKYLFLELERDPNLSKNTLSWNKISSTGNYKVYRFYTNRGLESKELLATLGANKTSWDDNSNENVSYFITYENIGEGYSEDMYTHLTSNFRKANPYKNKLINLGFVSMREVENFINTNLENVDDYFYDLPNDILYYSLESDLNPIPA